MKVLSTDGLTKLIELIKGAFISVDDTVTTSTTTLATVATSGSYNDLSNKPTIPSAVTELTVSGWGFTKNTGTVTKVNNVSPVNGNVTLSIPTTASDVNALPSSTKYGSTIDVTLSTTDYKQTITLKDQDGNTLNSKVVDFPVESMVVSGTFDSTNKKIVLTLQNGNTTDIPVGDLISGLQTEITSTNKLSADLIKDGTTNKVVTASEKSTWNGKQNALTTTQINNIAKGGTALQPNDDISELNNDAGYITGINSSDVTTALGYTPYNATNPSGYTSNVGTVTSVNNIEPVNGNVTITIPDSATWGNITGTLSNQTDLQNALNSKADADLTNVTDTAKVMMSGVGMPGNKYIDLTLGASGTTYTTPANGWFYFAKWAANDVNGFISLENRTVDLAAEWRNTIGLGRVYIPAKKGDVVSFTYDAQGATVTAKFIYAQGSESEAQ